MTPELKTILKAGCSRQELEELCSEMRAEEATQISNQPLTFKW